MSSFLNKRFALISFTMIKFFQACYDRCYFVIILLVIVPTEQKKVGDDDNVVANVDSVPPNEDG